MLGIIISLISIIVAAYLIIKKYYAPGALLLVGLVTIGISAIINPDLGLVAAKKATHFRGFDVIQVVTELLKTRAAGLGMNIMAIAGFSSYMDRIGAAGSLVRLTIKPLRGMKSPYLVCMLGYAIGLILNIFIPSAAGLGLLLMVSMYPLLVAAGASRQAAASTILLTGCCCFGPSGVNNLLAADLTKMHVMDFFINVQMVVGLAIIPVTLGMQYFVQRYFDKKDLESGRITQADFELPESTTKAGEDAPAWYALFPLIPVALLTVFSPLVYKGIRMEVVTALLTSTFIAMILDFLRRRSLKDTIETMRAFAQGMGKVFTSTVFLIVAAEVFAKGLTLSGGIPAVIKYASSMQSGCVAVFTAMFLICALAAFVTGSGNAPFFSFAPMIPKIAEQVGGNAAFMISPMQLVTGMGRSASPVAGVAIAVSGLSGVSPFELVRRTIPVMGVTVVALYIRALMLI